MLLYRPDRRAGNNYSWIQIGQIRILRDKTSQQTAKLQKTKEKRRGLYKEVAEPEDKRTEGEEKM